MYYVSLFDGMSNKLRGIMAQRRKRQRERRKHFMGIFCIAL